MKTLLQITNTILGSRHSVDVSEYQLLSQIPHDVRSVVVQANMYLFNLQNWNFRLSEFKGSFEKGTIKIQLPMAGAIVESVEIGGHKTCCRWTQDFEFLYLNNPMSDDSEVVIKYYTPFSVVVLDDDRNVISYMENFDYSSPEAEQYTNITVSNLQDVYEQCVILLARTMLNEGMQPEVVGAQSMEYRNMLKTLYKLDSGVKEMRFVI